MKRMDRLMAIIIALQQQPETAGRLADKFEVSKRTILRDMQALSEIGVPLYATAGPSGGFRLMDGFKLAPLQLDAQEALTVMFALRSLTQMADTPFHQARWTVLDKIKAIMPEQTLQRIEPLLEHVELEVPPRKVKTPHLSALLEHASKGRKIQALYRSEKHRRWLELFPRKIYAAHGFWYCEAHSVTHGEQRTFRVDRFERIDVSEQEGEATEFGRAPDARKRKEDPLIRIVARLTYRGALLAEQDFHIGELVKQRSENEWEVDFHCPATEREWAVKFFYSLGADAEVLEPERLRADIRDMALRICRTYEKEPAKRKESTN